MCATVLTLQTLTTPFGAATRYPDSNHSRVEQSEDHKQSLGRQWVVVTDENGSRRLRMHWTVARAVPPARDL
jgi:hypothetical protein